MGKKTYRLAVMGILTAIILLMTFVPFIGFIPWFGGVSATIIQIPVIVGAILLGPTEAIGLGLIFGIASLTRAIVMPNSVLDPFFQNPLISVLPRAFVGIAAWGVYALFRMLSARHPKIADVVGIPTATAIGALTNTVLTVGALYLIPDTAGIKAAMEQAGMADSTWGTIMLSIGVTNGIPEIIITAVLATAIILALKKSLSRRHKEFS